LELAVPDLIAQGPQPENRWRRNLQPGMRQIIGRQAGAWSTPWDDRISRLHVEIVYAGGRLQVTALESARNPIFFRGAKTENFNLGPGDHFVIGATTFTFVDQRIQVSLDVPHPSLERTFSVDELRRQPFREPDRRLDVLSRLPDVISGSGTDQELFVRLVNLLLSSIDRATAAAVVAVGGKQSGGSQTPEVKIVEVLHWDRRILADSDFRPSERLIRQAVAGGECVAYTWSGTQPRGEEQFTLNEGIDWALCSPVPGNACSGWALYVTGNFSSDTAATDVLDAELLRDDVKFTELTAATLSGLRESRLLAARQASLSHFFSPLVLQAISSQDPEQALAPREADVTVLFCDLRGFTRESERSAGDLFGLLKRVSQALGVMTHQILKCGGVIGDFHGDAAMGFWGWPIAQPDAVAHACQAALGIRAAFLGPNAGPSHHGGHAPAERSKSQSSAELSSQLSNFRVGIGIASGRAVAGRIGTIDQVKVTVFGPVVNLASRLETMTRQLKASILIDPLTAAVIRTSIGPENCRVRRLARVLPNGMTAPIDVSELLPPERDCPELSNEHLVTYEDALAAFERRDWRLAFQCLRANRSTDHANEFLAQFIDRHGNAPPPNWDGTVPLDSK
jgi:adenylate cyclase